MRCFGRTGWSPSSIVLMIDGVALVTIGLYFVLIRPPFLPEDLRYIGLPTTDLDTFQSALGPWLRQVFRVLGGFISATGALMIALAATSFREHRSGAAIGVLFGGGVSIGWMTIVNFMIESDFKWVLLVVAAIWASSLVLFLLEKISITQHGIGGE